MYPVLVYPVLRSLESPAVLRLMLILVMLIVFGRNNPESKSVHLGHFVSVQKLQKS